MGLKTCGFVQGENEKRTNVWKEREREGERPTSIEREKEYRGGASRKRPRKEKVTN